MKNDRKENHRTWLDGILLSAIFSLAVVIGVFIFTTGDSKFQSTTAAETNITKESLSVENSLSKSDSPFPDIELITESSNDKTIPYSLQYPKTSFKNINKEIEQYIANSKKEYFNEVRSYRNAHPTEHVLGDFRISSEIYPSSQDYYSFVLTNKSSVDRTKYDTTIQTFIYNKHTGEFVSTYQLLDEKIENLQALSEYVRNYLSESYKESLYKDKMLAATEPKWRLFNRIAIIDDHLVIYYDKNEIVDAKAGMPTVSIPLSYLNPILADPFNTTDISNYTIVSNTPSKGNGKRVALTFDDGPHETITREILKTLKKYDAKATFFMVGRRVQNNTNLVKEIYKNGHEIGNHTWNHPKLTTLSSKQVLTEINSTNDAIYKAIGEYPTVFRPPYGARNQRVTGLISVPIVLWTIDTLDWKYRDKDKLLPMVKSNLQNNSIILMHDIHQSTADGLDSVLAYLQKEGYECVTVSEILENK